MANLSRRSIAVLKNLNISGFTAPPLSASCTGSIEIHPRQYTGSNVVCFKVTDADATTAAATSTSSIVCG